MTSNTHRLMVGTAQRVRRSMGDKDIARDALEALADDRLWIDRRAGKREATAHVEGRPGAGAAVGGVA
ncbi:MAG: hypothetical protein K9G83_06975 [Hyphomonadaceae bacterium]|nr:hypothetical protein [Hyphomonadaceae bacterium]